MKNLIIILSVLLLTFTSCIDSTNKEADNIFPTWEKDLDHKYTKTNNSFNKNLIREYKVQPEDLIGTTGEKLFTKEVSQTDFTRENIVIRNKNLIMYEIRDNQGGGLGICYLTPIINEFGFVTGTRGIWITRDERYIHYK